MIRHYEAKVIRTVHVSFDDEGMDKFQCMQHAVDILENDDGMEDGDAVYFDLKLVSKEDD